jgi:hypothetical protein
LPKCFAGANAGRRQLAGWTKPTSKWPASGNTCNEQSTATATPSTSCSPPIAHRDQAAARWFLERAIGLHGFPEKITIDKSGANASAIQSVQADIELPQIKYLDNIVEQDPRAIKPIVYAAGTQASAA